MADAASDAEKLAVAKGFLLASPPGEVREVAKDVTKLVPRGLLSDTALRGIMHTYNVENCLPMQLPNEEESKRLVICQEGEVDASHYLDTHSQKVWGFDHVTQEILPQDVQDASAHFTSSLESLRAALQGELDSYMSAQFGNQGAAAVFATNSTITLILSTERVSLRNFWSGRWKSKWTLANVSPDSSAATLAGRIDLHVHYFEDGNLQLLSHKDVAAAQVCGGARSLAQAVLDTIRAEEHVVHSNLEDMYINMTEETFKEMRRVMPVTQTKMEWNLFAHRTAKDLSRK
ncbi:hypothetical protein H310_06738 [Aphanomyces invadans]|uniref:F-actin-capping protein subunit alpha n=1 Tax=Aphanomyces invadans TaxID=157072 RepID=A0A024U682_9STRA|nr:hypothetical protein H310_06738 [Aphanomyces invadans]ETW01128.1 hypothetical protein H310_06738 [Aphanomyces invadans]|eukprot:XP_008870126.1 hypothetical protein H310_06738 [Aphanomyces invadans]